MEKLVNLKTNLEEEKNLNRLEWYKEKLKYGLFWHGLRNRLARIGIDIKPYYWVQEESTEIDEPVIKGNNTIAFTLHEFGPSEIKEIAGRGLGYEEELMLDGLKNGQICLGLRFHEEIAAFMFIEIDDFYFKNKKFKLDKDEAYLFNMHVFEQFRGRNLAPYLKYQSFRLLDKMGRHNKYSITEYFNKSSIRFKKKLNANNLKLYINIQLFDLFNRTFLLHDYQKNLKSQNGNLSP